MPVRLYAAILLALLPAIQVPAQTPSSDQVVGRLASVYRSMQAFRTSWTLTRKSGSKELIATVRLLASRPNHYLLEIEGEKANTVVLSDAQNLTLLRPDRKAYTRSRAPTLLMGGDILAKADIPSPAARILTLLFEGTLRTSDSPLARNLSRAYVSPPEPFGSVAAHVVRFEYDVRTMAHLYVTAQDGLIRRVVLTENGVPVLAEDLPVIKPEEKLPSELFRKPLPPGAILVASLPPLPALDPPDANLAPAFEISDLRGGRIRLADFKGKALVMAFFQIGEPGANGEFNTLKKLDSRFRSQGLRLVLINAGDSPEMVAQFLQEWNIAWPCAVNDEETDIASLYKVASLPFFVIIDKEGKIAGRVAGHTANDTRIERILDKLGIRLN